MPYELLCNGYKCHILICKFTDGFLTWHPACPCQNVDKHTSIAHHYNKADKCMVHNNNYVKFLSMLFFTWASLVVWMSDSCEYISHLFYYSYKCNESSSILLTWTSSNWALTYICFGQTLILITVMKVWLPIHLTKPFNRSIDCHYSVSLVYYT